MLSISDPKLAASQKNTVMRKYLIWAVLPLFMACQSTATNDEESINILVSGDMLFEGPNSLQGEGSRDLMSLAESIGCAVEDIKSIKAAKAKVGMEEKQQSITESVLLQVVSDNEELMTLGTLNPIPAQGILYLNMAEETDLLPYLKDQGMTWVLDLNLSSDHEDMMNAKAEIGLVIEYTEKN